MRYARLLKIILLSVLLLAAAFFFTGENFETHLPSVRLSVTSGFYDEPFYLKMEGKNGRVFYTLDGSRPDENSDEYAGEIYITDATLNENRYSMRTDVSVSFLDEEIHEREAGSPEDYRAPVQPVDKCTVVRAVCIDKMGGRSEEVTGVYFVGYDEKTGYDGVHVVSVVTDPDNLFDYKKGIYVTGKATDDYLSGGERTDKDDSWWWWPANYRMKGKDWERETYLTVFDGDRECLMGKAVGVRVQGGGSRGYIPRSLRFFARRMYDNTDGFDGAALGWGYDPDAITLFSGGDSRITKLEDYLPSSLAGDLSISMMDYIPAVMFLNGEYWGFYYLTECYDERYFEAHYGVDPGDVVMIKEGEAAIGTQSDLQDYESDMAFLRNVDVSTEKGLAEAMERIDLDSYIDYYALQLYIDRRNDWPYMNIAAWKVRGDTGDKAADKGTYYDGRWRWILFDDNSGAYGVSSISSNSIENTRQVDPVFDNLMRSEEIADRLKERMIYLSESDFEPGRVRAFVESYRELVTSVMHKEFERFYGEKRDYDHSLQVRLDRFETFFGGRAEYIKEDLWKTKDSSGKS